MKTSLSGISLFAGLFLVLICESMTFPDKEPQRLPVSRIGFSQLQNEPGYKDLSYDVNSLYNEYLLSSFNEKGIISVKYLPVILNYWNPDTTQIRSWCDRYKLDAFLVTRINFGLDARKESGSKQMMANPEKIFISMKLYSKEGKFIDSADYKSYTLFRKTTWLYQEDIFEESVYTVTDKLSKRLYVQSNAFNISDIKQQTWQSYRIVLKDGTSQPVNRASRLYLCLYNNGSYYLENFPDSTKIVPGDSYDYNSAYQEIILHSKIEDLTFSVVGSNNEFLVLKPNKIENIKKIYFKHLSNQDIANLFIERKNEQIRDSIFANVSDSTSISEGPVFFVVEESASFQGGDLNTFRNYVLMQLIYPQEAQEKGISGIVIVQFIVGPDGFLRNIKVLRSSGSEILDTEAIRVIKISPKWKPGMQDGKPVNQLFTMPVRFISQ